MIAFCQTSGMPFVSHYIPVFRIIKCACVCVRACTNKRLNKTCRESDKAKHTQKRFKPEQELNTISRTRCMCEDSLSVLPPLFSVFMWASVCVHVSVLSVWPVNYASTKEEIHFTLSDSFKEVKTFRQHFCHSEQIPDLRTMCLTD